jgi:eukaryotic-like serine/threonine-protein kinase
VNCFCAAEPARAAGSEIPAKNRNLRPSETIVDSQSFLQEVRDHGLLSEQQLAAAAQKFAPDSPHHDLSAALIDQGWLTPFQAKQIAARQAKSLVLGQYRLLEELGRGGFGCVYKAVHQIMNRIVAVKVISPERVHDERARAWFRREVLATTQLQHPNIVMAYDANEVDGVLFLVMEYVDGPNLSDVVRAQGPLPVGLACTAMYQAARALQYAHERGMVHRDIKPGNLLMPRLAMGAGGDDVSRSKAASQVIVKIVDFGLARLQSLDSSNTLMGLKDKGFVGTPDYVSPEQARSIHEVDIRSDLYSLGCTFFFALTGRPPFRGQNALETVLQHLDEEAPSISALRTEVPQPLVSIFRRLLAKKPAQRFQSPADLVAEMNFFFGSGALAGALEPTPTAMSCLEAGRPRTPTPPLPLGMPGTPRTSSPAPVSPTIKPRDGRREDVSSDPEFVHTTVIPQSQPGRIGSRAPIPADSLTHRNAPAATLDCAPGVAPVSAPVPQPELDWNVEKPRFADAWRHWASVATISSKAGPRPLRKPSMVPSTPRSPTKPDAILG